MACTKEQSLITRFLNYQLNETKTKLQDSHHGISAAAGNPYGNLRTWNFIKENWNYLVSSK